MHFNLQKHNAYMVCCILTLKNISRRLIFEFYQLSTPFAADIQF